jgi:hypothetical protein
VRAQIINGRIRVDLIHNKQQVMRVVQLALAADLYQIQINQWGDDDSVQVFIGNDGTFAHNSIAGMLAMLAELDGKTPERLLEIFRDTTQFDETKNKIGQLQPQG